mmetsp:Transcript_47247/g.118301  ORF Transcript_47247/g.118301 Transcript_47247/m.118301 type:complete len:313 (-) Transcript_47247:31-969(-)
MRLSIGRTGRLGGGGLATRRRLLAAPRYLLAAPRRGLLAGGGAVGRRRHREAGCRLLRHAPKRLRKLLGGGGVDAGHQHGRAGAHLLARGRAVAGGRAAQVHLPQQEAVVVDLEGRACEVHLHFPHVVGDVDLHHGVALRLDEHKWQVDDVGHLVHHRPVLVFGHQPLERCVLLHQLLQVRLLLADGLDKIGLLRHRGSEVLLRGAGEALPRDLLAVLGDDVHRHEHVERVVHAAADVFLVIVHLVGRPVRPGRPHLHHQLVRHLVVRRLLLALHLLAHFEAEVAQPLGVGTAGGVPWRALAALLLPRLRAT